MKDIDNAMFCLSACDSEKAEVVSGEPEATIIKEKASFGIETAIKTSLLADDDYEKTVINNFSQITAEYEMLLLY
jgi:hypothetical protein